MHILLIGSGGREHAIAWKLAQADDITRISVAPGSAGMAVEPKVSTIDIDIADHKKLSDFAIEHHVHLTIVGPEVPLVAGIVDFFESAGQRILGPSKAAAQLEGSKGFAKAFMQKHAIPTANYRTFSNADDAHRYLDEQSAPIVVKADGLAAGKGVIVASTLDEAHEAVTSMLADNAFGDAGASVVIEEFLHGEEASFIALVDGVNSLPFATSQDHKARNDGDTGPNTGGMGAYSPAPVVTKDIESHVMDDIVKPTVAGLRDDGMPFKGFLYVGLMVDESGQARVVEYNVRLGDPETQPLLMRLQSDLLPLLDAATDGLLGDVTAVWRNESALGVVIAGGDYPASSSTGETITGIDDAEQIGCTVFHAGTAARDHQFVTNGGRVLCVTALGSTIKEAKFLADKGASMISFENMHYRNDIGHRAIARLR